MPDTQDAEILEGNERILFIDDEETIAKKEKTMLEKLGYKVTVKTVNFEMPHLFERQPDAFDLIIADQTMSGLIRFDIAQKVLSLRPDMPIILCTGYKYC